MYQQIEIIILIKSKAKMLNIFPIGVFIAIIKKHYYDWDVPIKHFMINCGETPFQILISTILSLRTKDLITANASKKLFKLGNTPKMLAKFNPKKIEQIIYPVGFYRRKAKQIIDISNIILLEHEEKVPNNIKNLLKLPGVGRKTANLVLLRGFNIPSICVDSHVHRISNRIGYIRTDNVKKTEFDLKKKLPIIYWGCYNRLLVSLGQIICKPISPICTKCPVSLICEKKGVINFR